MTPDEERHHLAEQLREHAQGTLQEWMRIVLLEDVAGIDFQVRARWQNHQGEVIIGETQYGEEYGRWLITVNVTDLGPMPPIGPENDPAQIMEQEPALEWVTRMWHDVRAGDTVRLPGTEHVAVVAERYWPPTGDYLGRTSWHVVKAEKHWDDHVVKIRPDGKPECVIRFTTDPAGVARFMDPLKPVEIQIDSKVLLMVNEFGWDTRTFGWQSST